MNQEICTICGMTGHCAEDCTTYDCACCNGTGWVPRDMDIGTDQECFCCDGTGLAATND